jgi:PIN domain nuclease of toxin-antitoxin system
VRLLLDTHVVLWWVMDDDKLTDDVKTRLDAEPGVFVSAASLWEISLKQQAGKLTGPPDLPERILAGGLTALSITPAHGIAAGRLPPIHRDPFDRVLVAQAVVEEMTLVTRDRRVQQYDVALLPV